MENQFLSRNRHHLHKCSIGAYALLLVFFLAGGFDGVGNSSIEANAMSAVVIEKDGEGRVHEVDPGDSILLRLPENPTTGYRWEVEFFDNSILGPPDSTFSTSGEPSMGAGGIRTFTFEARSPGQTVLRLILKRGWEPQQQAIDRFEITVQVK